MMLILVNISISEKDFKTIENKMLEIAREVNMNLI